MKLGELLLRERLITTAQLEEALETQRRTGQRLGSVLAELGHLEIDTVAHALSGQHRVPAVLTKHVVKIEPNVIALFKPRLASSLHAIPLGYSQGTPRRLIVALRDPATTPTEEIAFAAGGRVDVGVAPEILIRRCLERYYGVKETLAKETRTTSAARIPMGGGIELGPTDDSVGDSWPPSSAPAPTSAPRIASTPTMKVVRPRLSAPPAPNGAREEQARAEQLRADKARRARERIEANRLAEEELERARLEMAAEAADPISIDEPVPISVRSRVTEKKE